MTRRVLFQGGEGVRSALKVSLPGWDVVTAPLNGLAFDAEGAAFRVLKRGSHDQLATSAEAITTTTVNFPAQSRPPFACVYFRQYLPGTGTLSAIGISPWITIAQVGFPFPTTTYEYAGRVNVFNSSANFTIQHHSFSHFHVNYCFFIEVL